MKNLFFIRITLVLFCTLVFVTKTVAQQSSSQALVDAQEVFAKGQIELVPNLLNPCLESGTRSERTSAYRLLTLCHLYYNDITKATLSMTKMLKLSPEYELQDIDPSEFIHLYKTFRSNPFVIVGVKVGSALGNVYQYKNYNDVNSMGTGGTYSNTNTVLAGISSEFMIHDFFSIVLETYYSSTSFNFNRDLLNYATLMVNESNTNIKIPILAQWNITRNSNITPYLNIGTTLDLLLSAKSEVTRIDYIENYPKRELVLGSAVDVTDNRKSFNTALSAGAGVRIKNIVGNGYLSFDVRYNRYLNYNMEGNQRVGNDFLVYNYMHIDNALKFQNCEFLIGYKLPIYRPKQKRSVLK